MVNSRVLFGRKEDNNNSYNNDTIHTHRHPDLHQHQQQLPSQQLPNPSKNAKKTSKNLPPRPTNHQHHHQPHPKSSPPSPKPASPRTPSPSTTSSTTALPSPRAARHNASWPCSRARLYPTHRRPCCSGAGGTVLKASSGRRARSPRFGPGRVVRWMSGGARSGAERENGEEGEEEE